MSRIDTMTDDDVQKALGEVYGAIEKEDDDYRHYVANLEASGREMDEQITAVHSVLDGMGVPRSAADGRVYTPAERVMFLKEQPVLVRTA